MINNEEMPTNRLYYYVYKITNKINHKIYIGCHQTLDLNDGYMGSGVYIRRAYEKYGIENFEKEIIQFYSTAKEMFDAEAAIVNREFIKEDSNYNLAEGGKGEFKGDECYSSSVRLEKIRQKSLNKVTVKDIDNNTFKVSKNDSRLKTKELVGITKGKATVKDKNGKILKVDVDDPRIASSELVGNTKGYTQTAESNKKRSDSLKGIKRTPTFVSCKFCKKLQH